MGSSEKAQKVDKFDHTDIKQVVAPNYWPTSFIPT